MLSRQLKICSTLFELTVGLLRATELVARIAPGLFLDVGAPAPRGPAAEMLLTRLFQVRVRRI